MSRFLVLEGDNGSGKSTVAALLGSAGLFVASHDPELQDAEREAKKLRSRERMRAFYAYNHQTVNLVRAYGADCVVVRYWPSTLAAGYADGIIDKGDLLQLCRDNIKTFLEPVVFVYLKCAPAERARRIVARDAPGARDNCSLTRARKYQYAIGHIALAAPTPWTFLPSDAMPPHCLAQRILDLFGAFTSEPLAWPQA